MAIITISRGTMSGGEAFATNLAAMLGYPLIGREVLVSAAEKLGVSEETLAQKITRGPGLWERLTSNRRFYVVAVQSALAEHTASGNLVYHGHAGHLLLRQIPTVLRVRLIAPLPVRVAAVMERQRLDRDAAVEYIHHVDEERVRWTRFIYGVDWSDPALYDVVVNLDRMPLRAACTMIAGIVDEPEYVTNDAVQRTLADFRLACRVKVALATNPLTRDIDLEVTSHEGAVEITGELPHVGVMTGINSRDEEAVIHTSQGVDGVKNVIFRSTQTRP